ncbi:hypothetical protein ANANG_G00051100, partial [Anguilla anguilla]
MPWPPAAAPLQCLAPGPAAAAGAAAMRSSGRTGTETPPPDTISPPAHCPTSAPW